MTSNQELNKFPFSSISCRTNVLIFALSRHNPCNKQAAFHHERAGAYAKQHNSLQDAQIGAMQYSNGDPKKALADKQAEHENKARELTFIADHIKLDAEYLLDRKALAEIGVIRSHTGFF